MFQQIHGTLSAWEPNAMPSLQTQITLHDELWNLSYWEEKKIPTTNDETVNPKHSE